jgi:hypothetical protein
MYFSIEKQACPAVWGAVIPFPKKLEELAGIFSVRTKSTI